MFTIFNVLVIPTIPCHHDIHSATTMNQKPESLWIGSLILSYNIRLSSSTAAEPHSKFSKIMVVIDGSEHSLKAVIIDTRGPTPLTTRK